MEKALSIDHIRDETFKDLNICHLVSLDQVSHAVRSAVRSYKYTKRVDIYENVLPPNIVRSPAGDLYFSGPIITSAYAGSGLMRKLPAKVIPQHLKCWADTLETLNAMADTLESVYITNEQLDMPEKAMHEMIGLSNNMATFPKCTKLDLHISDHEDAFGGITPKILSFFPAVKILTIHASIVPPLSYLPNPEILEKLIIHTNVPNRKASWYTKTPMQVGPKVMNFPKLTSFVLHLNVPPTFLGCTSSDYKNLFGINWEETLKQCPPPLKNLVVKTEPHPIGAGCPWIFDLIKACAPTMEGLKLDFSFSMEMASSLQRCLHGLPGKTYQLPALKSLFLFRFEDRMVCSFLNIIKMPALESMTILLQFGILSSFKVVIESIDLTLVYSRLKTLFVKANARYKPKLEDLKRRLMPALDKYTFKDFKGKEKEDEDAVLKYRSHD